MKLETRTIEEPLTVIFNDGKGRYVASLVSEPWHGQHYWSFHVKIDRQAPDPPENPHAHDSFLKNDHRGGTRAGYMLFELEDPKHPPSGPIERIKGMLEWERDMVVETARTLLIFHWKMLEAQRAPQIEEAVAALNTLRKAGEPPYGRPGGRIALDRGNEDEMRLASMLEHAGHLEETKDLLSMMIVYRITNSGYDVLNSSKRLDDEVSERVRDGMTYKQATADVVDAVSTAALEKHAMQKA